MDGLGYGGASEPAEVSGLHLLVPKKRFLNVFWMGNIMKYVNGVCFGLPRSTVFISHNSSFFVIGSLGEALPSFTAR